jgi:hypothetical protein
MGECHGVARRVGVRGGGKGTRATGTGPSGWLAMVGEFADQQNAGDRQ